MIRKIALALSLIAPRVAHAQMSPEFKPMEFLVGSCWQGTFPDGKQTDEHCFTPVFGGKFIRDVHVVRGGGPYAGETLYAVEPSTKQVTFTYWNSPGQVMTGRMDIAADTLVFPTKMGSAEIRATWIRTGNDSYRIHQAQKTSTGWKDLWTMEMKRTRAAAAER